MQKLERVQNKALRNASRLAKGCPVDFLRLEKNVEPLELRLQKNDEILWDRYERLQETDTRNQLIKKDVPPRLTTRHGFRNRTQPRMAQWNIKQETSTGTMAPWLKLRAI